MFWGGTDCVAPVETVKELSVSFFGDICGLDGSACQDFFKDGLLHLGSKKEHWNKDN